MEDEMCAEIDRLRELLVRAERIMGYAHQSVREQSSHEVWTLYTDLRREIKRNITEWEYAVKPKS